MSSNSGMIKVNNTANLKLRQCQGFTLLEALIGFLILSIGMLGIASLQAISLKSGKTSVYGSVAMMKVDELFESMRINPTALSDYTLSGDNKGCTDAVNCNESELALTDVYWWEKNLTAGLPGTTSTTVSVTPAVAPAKMAIVTVTITWSERNKETAATAGSAGSVSRNYTATSNICTGVPC